MAIIQKPNNLSTIWAEAGAKQQPDELKIVTGWEVEIPPLQVFNWHMYRGDASIAHINQRGIPEWDGYTEYQAGLSYTQGADGKIYKATVTGVGLDPRINPQAWEEAFLTADGSTGGAKFIGYSFRSTNFTAAYNQRYYASQALDMYLPPKVDPVTGVTIPTGSTIAVGKKPGVVVKVYANGCLIQTAAGPDTDVYYDFEGPAYFVFNGIDWEA